MKNILNKAALVLVSSSMLLAACEKNDSGELEGPIPQGTFTTTTKTAGLTTEVTFTAAPNSDAFLYEWEFGDGSGPDGTGSVATGQTVKHTYTKGGTFHAQLITVGRGGTGFSDKKDVVIPSTLNVVKQLLTGNTSKTWMLNNGVDSTITVGPSDTDPYSYYHDGKAGSLPACQADDEFTFSAANVYTYDAKAQTFVAGNTGGCQAPRSTTTPFTFGAATGTGLAQFTLANAGTFIGITDAPGMTYRIVKIDDRRMTLLAGSTAGGLVFTIRLIAK